MDEAMGGAGKKIMDGLHDARYRGWEKWQHVHRNPDGTNTVIHYVRNPATGLLTAFKFKYATVGMLVRCISNEISSVDPRSTIGKEVLQSVGTGMDRLDISVGRVYTVYAIAIRSGYPWYFIADDLYDDLLYPLAYARCFFEVTDRQVSRCWSVGYQSSTQDEGPSDILFTFREWANKASFFERLIDGNGQELETFQRYKVFMDMEHPVPSVKDVAELVDNDWLMCPKCSEAWESNTLLGMTSCPKCSAVLLNPRYSALGAERVDS